MAASLVPGEKTWIIQVRNFFEQEVEEHDQIDRPISIFNVPNALKAVKPEAYAPQMIALGPYHHWREEMYEMERYKLLAAKKVQTLFKSLKFQTLVDKLSKSEHKIRSCYHKYLSIDGETLSWMMAIDALFLLQFLHIYVNRNDSVLASSARMSFLVDSKGKKLGYDTLLKDILMLENQIPIFVMKKILRIQCSNLELADKMLPPMFLGVCKEISPLKLKEDYPLPQVLKCAHLLDLLYNLIVPICEEGSAGDGFDDSLRAMKDNGIEQQGFGIPSNNNKDQVVKVFKELWEKIMSLGLGFVQKIKDGPLKLVTTFAPVVSKLSTHLTHSKNGESSNGKETAIRVEEIMIPSVTHLSNAGVEFCPTTGDLSTIKFDTKTNKFYLPVINLDINSEVIMRNLVAYEASAISGPLVFARYTELMNGIVDTEQDVRILADKDIIKSEFSYEQVANIWNGMSRSIRLSRVDFMDKAIRDVNAYFYSTKKVRFYRTMKAYVYGSWRMLVLFASMLVIGLMGLQSFCTVYSCPRVFHLGTQN